MPGKTLEVAEGPQDQLLGRSQQSLARDADRLGSPHSRLESHVQVS